MTNVIMRNKKKIFAKKSYMCCIVQKSFMKGIFVAYITFVIFSLEIKHKTTIIFSHLLIA